MEKSVRNILIVFFGVVALLFIVWNFFIKIEPIQILIIVGVCTVVGVILLFLHLYASPNRFRKNKDAYITAERHCMELWKYRTMGEETLTYEGSGGMPKVYTSAGGSEKMTIYAFLFTKNNPARNQVLIYYCLEKNGMIGHIPDPDSEKVLSPFKDFNPFSHQTSVKDYDKRVGTQVIVGGAENKKALDMQKEDYNDNKK